MRPLLRADARPIKDEWKIKPYFGVFPRVFSALKNKTKRLRFGTHDIYIEESTRGNKTGRIKIF